MARCPVTVVMSVCAAMTSATLNLRGPGKICCWRNERAGLQDAMLVKGVKLTAAGHRHADPKQRVFKAERIVIDGRKYDLYPDRD